MNIAYCETAAINAGLSQNQLNELFYENKLI